MVRHEIRDQGTLNLLNAVKQSSNSIEASLRSYHKKRLIQQRIQEGSQRNGRARQGLRSAFKADSDKARKWKYLLSDTYHRDSDAQYITSSERNEKRRRRSGFSAMLDAQVEQAEERHARAETADADDVQLLDISMNAGPHSINSSSGLSYLPDSSAEDSAIRVGESVQQRKDRLEKAAKEQRYRELLSLLDLDPASEMYNETVQALRCDGYLPNGMNDNGAAAVKQGVSQEVLSRGVFQSMLDRRRCRDAGKQEAGGRAVGGGKQQQATNGTATPLSPRRAQGKEADVSSDTDEAVDLEEWQKKRDEELTRSAVAQLDLKNYTQKHHERKSKLRDAVNLTRCLLAVSSVKKDALERDPRYGVAHLGSGTRLFNLNKTQLGDTDASISSVVLGSKAALQQQGSFVGMPLNGDTSLASTAPDGRPSSSTSFSRGNVSAGASAEPDGADLEARFIHQSVSEPPPHPTPAYQMHVRGATRHGAPTILRTARQRKYLEASPVGQQVLRRRQATMVREIERSKALERLGFSSSKGSARSSTSAGTPTGRTPGGGGEIVQLQHSRTAAALAGVPPASSASANLVFSLRTPGKVRNLVSAEGNVEGEEEEGVQLLVQCPTADSCGDLSAIAEGLQIMAEVPRPATATL